MHNMINYFNESINMWSMKRKLTLVLFLLLSFIHQANANCDCEDEVEIYFEGNIRDLKLAAPGAQAPGAQAAALIKVKLKPGVTYTLNIDCPAKLQPFDPIDCPDGKIHFPCGVVFRKNGATHWDATGNQIVNNYHNVPEPAVLQFKLAADAPGLGGQEEGGDGDPSDSNSPDSGSGEAGGEEPPGKASPAEWEWDAVNSSFFIKPATTSIAIPLGRIPTGANGTAPYRSAGVIYASGAIADSLANPNQFTHEGDEEVMSFVTSGAIGSSERRIDTPTRLFRITGYNGTNLTPVSLATAQNTYVREYEKSTPDEEETVTLAKTPASWWKVAQSQAGEGIRIEQSVDGVERFRELTVTNSGQNAELVEATNFFTHSTVTTNISTYQSKQVYTDIITVARLGKVISKTEMEYVELNHRFLVAEKREFPDPALSAHYATSYKYRPGGQLWAVSYPDGSWQVRESVFGGDVRIYKPFGSGTSVDMEASDEGALPVVGAGSARIQCVHDGQESVITLAQLQSSPGDTGTITRVRSPQTQTYYATYGNIPTRETKDGSLNEIFYNTYDPPSNDTWLHGMPICKYDTSNGRFERYEYAKSGQEVSVTKFVQYVEPAILIANVMVPFPAQVVPGLSTKTVTKFGRFGMVKQERWYHAGGSFQLAESKDFEYQNGRYHRTLTNGVETHRVSRISPLVHEAKDSSGTITTYEYNVAGELVSARQSAVGGIPGKDYSYETDGLVTTTRTNGRVVRIQHRDGLGRQTAEEDQAGAITLYSFPNGGLDQLTTLPGNVEMRVERYLDGRIKAHSGNGWIAEFYSYEPIAPGVIPEGQGDLPRPALVEKHSKGFSSSHNGTMTEAFYSQYGGLLSETKPSASPEDNRIRETYQYLNNEVLPWRQTVEAVHVEEISAAGAVNTTLPTRYVRGFLSSVGGDQRALDGAFASGLDLDGNAGLSLTASSSGDRFQSAVRSYVWQEGAVWLRQDLHAYPDLPDTTPATTTRLTMLGPVGNAGEQSLSSTTKEIDVAGRTRTEIHKVFPASATEEVSQYDSTKGSGFVVRSTYIAGHLQTVSRAGAPLAESYVYDLQGRLSRFTDFRGGVTRYFYNGASQLQRKIDAAGESTLYAYVPSSQANAGKLSVTTDPDGRTEEILYTLRGEVQEILGTGTYRKKYQYSNLGQLAFLTTYGTSTATTFFSYNAAGKLVLKIYGYGSAEQNYDSYEYTPEGLLAKRTSAGSVTKQCVYDPVTRDLTQVNYSGDSDRTPDLVFSEFDGLGRPGKVEEHRSGGVITSQGLVYSRSTNSVSVQYPTGHLWLPGVKIAHPTDGFGRPNGYQLTAGGSSVFTVSYQYDTLSRLQKVLAFPFEVNYTYIPGSETPNQMLTKRAGAIVQRRDFAINNLGRIEGVVNSSPPTPGGTLQRVAAVGHAYDSSGRRSDAKREDGTWWDYGYNSRSEVTSAIKRNADESLVPGLSFTYQYDGIGNRTSATYGTGTGSGVNQINYAANRHNQYTFISTPANLYQLVRSDQPVAATSPNASVAAIEMAGSFAGIRLAAASPHTGKVVSGQVTRTGQSALPFKTWMPPTSYSPTYDADGNLLDDGRWTYTWDGENRLVSMVPKAAALSGGADNIELGFTYDFAGRRIGKTIIDKTVNPVVYRHVSYAYDNWNPVAEWERPNLGGSLVLTRGHIWGLDIGSTGGAGAGQKPNFQNAGGVGGLLLSSYHQTGSSADMFIPCYDANGNIIAWTSGAGLVRRMDYDPFGNTVVREDFSSLSARLPSYGFSTKPEDKESGLLYYGYRYYDPVTGRWPSRDPIGENGGINIYGMVSNNLLSRFDKLGLLSLFTGNKKCSVIVGLGHTGSARNLSDQIGEIAKNAEEQSVCGGVMGCPLTNTKAANQAGPLFNSTPPGAGIPGFISPGGDFAGSVSPEFINKWNKENNDALPMNPAHNGGLNPIPNGEKDAFDRDNQSMGFMRMIEHNWRMALEQGERMANDCPACCKEIKVSFLVALDAGKVYANNIKNGTGKMINGVPAVENKDLSDQFRNLDGHKNPGGVSSIPSSNKTVTFKCRRP